MYVQISPNYVEQKGMLKQEIDTKWTKFFFEQKLIDAKIFTKIFNSIFYQRLNDSAISNDWSNYL
jgi:hypothetical protein